MSLVGYDIIPSSRNVVVFYEDSFETTGGIETYSYTVTSGELPTGLNLSINGELSGTPAATGTFTFIVTVTGDDGEIDAHIYSLTIAPEPVIQVSSVEDLNNVRNDLDGNYIQIADIDLSGAPWVTIGTYSNHFTGNYDGNRYKITNLNFTGGHNVGLFSVISGNIENLVLENLSINSESRVGGLAGRLWDGGTIRNTHIQGTGRIYGDFVIGGLVGENRGTINRSFVTVKTLSEGPCVGGIAGTNYALNAGGGTINQSYATNDVESTEHWIGGLVGDNRQVDSYIIESYATGKVTGTGNIGGLVGLSHDGTVEKSYYDESTSLQNDVGSGTPKLTAEMKQEAIFVDWDFEDVWTIDEGVTYPRLQ